MLNGTLKESVTEQGVPFLSFFSTTICSSSQYFEGPIVVNVGMLTCSADVLVLNGTLKESVTEQGVPYLSFFPLQSALHHNILKGQ